MGPTQWNDKCSRNGLDKKIQMKRIKIEHLRLTSYSLRAFTAKVGRHIN